MEKLIPLLILLLFAYFVSTYWLKNYNKKNEIESIDSNRKMDFGKLVNVHIRNVKIGSIILIAVVILKMIYLFLNEKPR